MEKIAITKAGKKLLEAEVLRSTLSQTKGLMFATKAKPLLFVFPTCRRRCIHSFFCPVFDAIFLDAEKKVVAIYPVVQRGRSGICANCTYLLECPVGSVEKFNIKLRDKLQWKLKKS